MKTKLARFLFGIGGIFFAICAYQWLQAGAFRLRFGRIITREEDPARFWIMWCTIVIGSVILLWICLTWKKRNIFE